jgi:hypothetical protein
MRLDREELRGDPVSRWSPNSVHSPSICNSHFNLGGAKIDPQSLRVTLLTTPEVDLTSRVKPFVQANGIDMPDAETPAGEYNVRVELKDSDGRSAAKIFSLKVSE